MKKLMLTVTSALLISSSLFAQNFHATAKLPDGIRISVGDNNNRNVMGRMMMLERAVRDLQNRVYQLEDTRPNFERWSCRVTAFGKTYMDEGTTRNEAENRTIQKCERQNNAMFCEDVKCFKN